MGFYRVGDGIAGKPGIGLYDVSAEQLQKCCCGWQVKSLGFVTTGTPDCFLIAQGSPSNACTGGSKTPEAALALAIGYIAGLNYITKCNPTALNPDPEENFCQNKTPIFTYITARDSEAGYEFDFEVEDCGIPPVDYIATVKVGIC